MQIQWSVLPPEECSSEAVIFFVPKNAKALPAAFTAWAGRAAPWILTSRALHDFQAEPQRVEVLYSPAEARIPRAIVAGLGEEKEIDLEKLRGAAAAAFRKARDLKLRSVGIPLQALEGLPFPLEKALEEAVTGGLSGLYRYDVLKTRDRDSLHHLEGLQLFSTDDPEPARLEAVARAEAVISGIYMARDLTTAPSNDLTPTRMMEESRKLAERHGFALEVIDQAGARELGMGAFTAVAQGSLEPAYFIVMEHAPETRRSDPPLVLIGKGITFDTGGISIKPSQNLEAMKHDMAGAAAVLGAMEAIGRQDIQRRVVALLPCTENMPDGKAYKPGDVLRTLAGLTVEVISTDAEGRLILCDALAYAQRFQPAAVLDIATLTGACIVALGDQAAGIMGNRQELVEAVRTMGDAVGERFWPLPLWDLYFESIKSDVADFKNVGDRKAGTIIGGIFLKQFVPDVVPWVHLDIAGTAWADKDREAIPKGATGFGVRTLFEVVRGWEEIRPR